MWTPTEEEFRVMMDGSLPPGAFSIIKEPHEPEQGIDIDNQRGMMKLDNWMDGIDDHDAVLASVEAMDGPIKENFIDIMLDYDVLYRNPNDVFLRVSASEWHELFGDEPEHYDDWEPIWEMHEKDLVVMYEIFEGESVEDAGFAPILERDDIHVLSITCDYAVELSEVGFLSLKQAQAYLLQRFGFKHAEIAKMMGIERGTVSSHATRGMHKMKRTGATAAFQRHLDDEAPVYWKVLEERLGDVYWDPYIEQHVRICELDNIAGIPLYLVQYEDGDEVDVTLNRVHEQWELREDADIDFPPTFQYVPAEEHDIVYGNE